MTSCLISRRLLWSFILACGVAAAEKPNKVEVKTASSFPCIKRVFETLERWEVPEKWETLSEGQTANLKSKTKNKDVEIHLRHGPKFSEVSRTSSEGRRILNFVLPSCDLQFKLEILKPIPGNTNTFTDLELAKLLANSEALNKKGIIYIWSPHMNLSVLGVAEARSIAKELGLEFIPLLEPHADPQVAQRIAKAHNLSAQSLVRLESNVLMEQGALFHYPTAFLFSKGRLLNLARPGYDEQMRLRKFLRDSFK